MMGLPLAQVAVHFGADDVQGPVVREQIFQAAGASAGTEQKVAELVRFVGGAGRTPVQRDRLYNETRGLAAGTGWAASRMSTWRLSSTGSTPRWKRSRASRPS